MDPESYVVRVKAFSQSVRNSAIAILAYGLLNPHLAALQSPDRKTDGRTDGPREQRRATNTGERKRENADLSSSSSSSADQMSKAKEERKEEGLRERREEGGRQVIHIGGSEAERGIAHLWH